ncbi:MAG: MCE family protein [Deltaproteobacteria bacterium]|nr:MCE family protein [Deltaproteobacteria bacterium]
MNAPGSDERNLELRVGAMILVALAMLVTFIMILGDWSFKSKQEISVYFQNPGGLSGGAAVKVAGRKVGTITEMSFLGQTGPRNPMTGIPSMVRTRIYMDEEVCNALRQDAKFYVTTKGVLGDPFLEIDPGVSPVPMDSKEPLFGLDPPRLDLFVADAYQLVKTLNGLIERNTENLDTLLGGGARLMGVVEDAVADGGIETGRFDSITKNVEELLTETRELVTGAKEKYVDDPKIDRMISNLESLSGKLNREIDPMLKEIRGALAEVERLTETIGPEEQKRIREAIARLDDIMTRTDKMVITVTTLVEKMRRGEGTVGQLLTDEEIYDDIKELIRDIKKHPWKIIWED